MLSDVNGIVYFAGKEKAVIEGFFGKTVNPEIVFLFINKAGQKYFINYENIIVEKNIKEDIIPGNFYEFRKSGKGKRFIVKKAKDTFDLKLIEDELKSKDLKENIEFNSKIAQRELDEQFRVRKRRNFVLDFIYLFIILSIFSFTQKAIYAIPFIVLCILGIIYLNIYIRNRVKYIEKI